MKDWRRGCKLVLYREKKKKVAHFCLDRGIIESTCGREWKGVGQRDVQSFECRTCAFRSYSDYMAETGSRLEQPVSLGRVLSRFRGSLRAEPPSSSDHGGLTRGQVASSNAAFVKNAFGAWHTRAVRWQDHVFLENTILVWLISTPVPLGVDLNEVTW